MINGGLENRETHQLSTLIETRSFIEGSVDSDEVELWLTLLEVSVDHGRVASLATALTD